MAYVGDVALSVGPTEDMDTSICDGPSEMPTYSNIANFERVSDRATDAGEHPRLNFKDYSARTESEGDCTSPSASPDYALRLLLVAFRPCQASSHLVDRDLTCKRPHTGAGTPMQGRFGSELR